MVGKIEAVIVSFGDLGMHEKMKIEAVLVLSAGSAADELASVLGELVDVLVAEHAALSVSLRPQFLPE